MNIVVCAKQVVDAENLTEIVGETFIDDPDLPRVVNMCDLVALEEALQLRDTGIVDEVVAVSMGAPSSLEAIYRCLAMGADKGLFLCDSAFEGSDSHATAVVLAKAIGSLGFDLILCGQRASDTEAGQVGYRLAELLDVPVISGAAKLQVFPDKKVIVHRKLKVGFQDVMEVPLPAVISVEKGLNEPRYVGMRAISMAKRKEITQWNIKDLGLSSKDVGQSGSKTRVISVSRARPKKIFVPDSNLSAIERLMLVESGGIEEKEGSIISGSPEDAASRLVQMFLSQKVLRI